MKDNSEQWAQGATEIRRTSNRATISTTEVYDLLLCYVQGLVQMAGDKIHYIREGRKRNDASRRGQLYKRITVWEGSSIFKDMYAHCRWLRRITREASRHAAAATVLQKDAVGQQCLRWRYYRSWSQLVYLICQYHDPTSLTQVARLNPCGSWTISSPFGTSRDHDFGDESGFGHDRFRIENTKNVAA